MLKRHEIEILLKAGHPKKEVARLAGVSGRSIHRIGKESPVGHVNDSAKLAQRNIGRPSMVKDFRKFILDLLKEKADLPSWGNSPARTFNPNSFINHAFSFPSPPYRAAGRFFAD